MKIIVNEKNTHVIADEGKLLYFVVDEENMGFSECYIPEMTKEEDFIEKPIEEIEK